MMIEVQFKCNKNNFNNRKKFWEDENLNQFIDFLFKINVDEVLLKEIRILFSIYTKNNFTEALNSYRTLYESDAIKLKYFDEIESYFINFIDIYSKDDFSHLRGAFLELFIYKFLLKKYYPFENIKRESQICIDSFVSTLTVDVAFFFKNCLEAYECKFSSRFIKRNVLDNLYSIQKKCSCNSKMCIVFFENKESVCYKIKSLIGNTNQETFSDILRNINFITLEDFTNIFLD